MITETNCLAVPFALLARAKAVLRAAELLLPSLTRGERIDAKGLRRAMQTAFGASDADGSWDWKMAYEACEIASVLFLVKHGPAMIKVSKGTPSAMLPMIAKVAALLPSHTRRSLESQIFQQFSTPLPLALAASVAAQVTSTDRVLEPSAGTGILAVFAELAGGSLLLNELAASRAALLDLVFPGLTVTRFDAAQIDDHLDAALLPSVVLMNPPFSATANVDHPLADTALRHVSSALARLEEGGRLVAITAASLAPDNPAWTDAFVQLQERSRLVFSAAIDGVVYTRHGTTTATRMLVIDKRPAPDARVFPRSAGTAPDVRTLLGWITARVPQRLPTAGRFVARADRRASPPSRDRRDLNLACPSPLPTCSEPEGCELVYDIVDEVCEERPRLIDALYETYQLQSIRIPGAQPHPTKLVQSAAMASVRPPRPSYRPHLPARIVTEGALSGAQLESLIYAGEAHGGFLAGCWTVDETFDQVHAASEDTERAVRFRRGWFLGDGTGAGKGRQVAGILLDNWLKGRRRAVWISRSDKLIEDARRDWAALGMERLQVTPLARFRQGTPIRLDAAVLFTTYATLRIDAKAEKLSRVRQIVDWVGRDFDGVIIFDESHAMQNAAGSMGNRGEQAASQQGRAGLRLQHALPNARIVYVSATGATTVHNLAYAQRLGLWGGEDFPFATRADFVAAIEEGGVAAMEVMARDLRALGLYTARSLSFEGVEYELLEHRLTNEQVRIYDAYADAFAVIHNNLEAAMRAANITGATGTLNAQARSAARSAFETAKQRFFGHLLTSMKTPTLIQAIKRDLEAGHAAVVQIVSTGEALMERRLAEIPTEDWGDVQVDITPREYVLDYLAHSFPVQLYEPFTDGEGNLLSRPVIRDGQPVESREAAARRDRMIEHLASLAPVPGALDQIVQRFGTDVVAEVTGRSRRIVRIRDRMKVETRATSANLAEAAAFMDDQKRILVFSDAGGTGRSYHAELSAKNKRLRVHYLLEPGWKADAAIQGLGRTNRTNQAQPPLFRPLATDVKAEKRFLSTIARRLDTLGAITRGQRQTGGQGLFRPEDNLESPHARDALRQLYGLLARGQVGSCSLQRFEQTTGLKLTDENGLRDELPSITTFLNRLLALTIELQNILFTVFEQLLAARIEGAIASGTYEAGLETLRAESFVVKERRTIYAHPATGAETHLAIITQRDRNRPMPLDEALERLLQRRAVPLRNGRSGRAAIQVPAPSWLLDDGEIERRVHLIGPMGRQTLPLAKLAEHDWIETDREQFKVGWSAEFASIPDFTITTIYLVTGLLLPIWKRLPQESTRVYLLQTDAGERIIGRKVPLGWVTAVSAERPSVAPEDAFTSVLHDGHVLDLHGGLQLRRARVMGAHRIELSGFPEGLRDRLKAYGLIGEIISWKLRMFVPTDASGPAILARILEQFPPAEVRGREPS
ncbi:putative methylase/helicase [Bradyrhizobium sp. ORS 375]|uniref:strawberry notch-like NTP hydrolase domain-containing protein n=1 Tax=Bradyrhizobium sp. (strain ORS 375) TaxID=566679 RepID=UPI00024090F5|nr:strawberry notch family protein [Bradyrhizobium sp. ORS 375]CCD93333.1 putative methylase/helicase [Bradyrhizobium sp. ORS 375]